MRRVATNTIRVELQKFGESARFYDLPEWATVQDLMDEAELDYGTELKYKGETVNLDDELEDRDLLVITTKDITQG